MTDPCCLGIVDHSSAITERLSILPSGSLNKAFLSEVAYKDNRNRLRSGGRRISDEHRRADAEGSSRRKRTTAGARSSASQFRAFVNAIVDSINCANFTNSVQEDGFPELNSKFRDLHRSYGTNNPTSIIKAGRMLARPTGALTCLDPVPEYRPPK
jgi:hypothetical protein